MASKKKPKYAWHKHEEIAAINSTIQFAVGLENPDDLRILPDQALAELLRRRGIEITSDNVAYHRAKLGIPGSPSRLKKLIKQSQQSKQDGIL